MKKLCKNCKYFENNTKDNNMGWCKNKHFSYGYPNYYDLDDYVRDNQDKCVLFFDCDEYSADLYIGENFGCIYWSNKSTKKYIVLLESCEKSNYYVYLTDGEGDPPRTLVKENAYVFLSYESAMEGLRKAKMERPFKNGKVLVLA